MPEQPDLPTLSPGAVERQFLEAQRRARRYWYEDGLAELAIGAAFVILALYFVASSVTSGRVGRAGAVAINLLFPALVFTACLGLRRLIGWMKERLVYPRAGYVSFPPSGRRLSRSVTGIVAGFIAALIAVLARSASGVEAWIPALQGLVIAAFFASLGRLSGLPRFTLLGLLSALAGVLISLARVSTSAGAALFFGSVGAALVFTGSGALRRFMKAFGEVRER